MMKGDQRVMLTKRLLQKGLFRLLEKKRIDEINVSELCAESGINRATFYRHYTQPRDILRDTRHHIVKDVQAIAKKAKTETHLCKRLEELCRYCYDQKRLLCILFETRTDDEFVEIISELCNDPFYFLQNKQIQAQDEDSLKLTAYGYAGGFYYILRQWLMEPFNQTPEDVAAVMYRFITGI